MASAPTMTEVPLPNEQVVAIWELACAEKRTVADMTRRLLAEAINARKERKAHDA